MPRFVERIFLINLVTEIRHYTNGTCGQQRYSGKDQGYDISCNRP